MMDQKLAGLKDWFFRHMKGGSKPYWVLTKQWGQSHRVITSHETDDADESFESLKKEILGNFQNGVNQFEVRAAKSGKTDTRGMGHKTLDLMGLASRSNTQVAGFGNSSQPGVYGMDYINAITSNIELRKDFQAFKGNLELQKKLDEKDTEIEFLKTEQRTPVEKAVDSISGIVQIMADPEISKMVLGLYGMFKGQPVQPGVYGPPNGANIQEEPAATGNAEVPTEEDEKLSEQEWKCVQVCRAFQAKNVPIGDLMEQLFQAYCKDPLKVMTALASFKTQENG